MTDKRPSDRRRATRVQKLLTLKMEHDGRGADLVTTDVSLRGTFVHAPPDFRLPVGADLALKFSDGPDAPVIEISAKIVRVIARASRVSRIPGMALEFLQFSCAAGIGPLSDFVQNVLCYRLGREDARHMALEDDGSATFTPPEDKKGLHLVSKARHVHAERMSPERTLPGDAKEAEELMRKIVTDIERRRVKRFAMRTEVTWYQTDGLPHSGVVLNVSQRGMFVQTDHKLPRVGSRVRLKFPIEEEGGVSYVKIEAIVRRRWNPSNESMPGFGIRFERIDEMGHTGIFRMWLRSFENSGATARRRRGYHYARKR